MRSSDAIIFITKMIGQAITVQAGTPMTVQGDGAGKDHSLLALLLPVASFLVVQNPDDREHGFHAIVSAQSTAS